MLINNVDKTAAKITGFRYTYTRSIGRMQSEIELFETDFVNAENISIQQFLMEFF